MARRTWALGLVALLVAAGCGLGGKDEDNAAADPVPSAVAASDAGEPEFEPITESPTPEPVETTSKAPAKKPTTKPQSAEPTVPPFWSQLPDCAHYDKTKPVSKTKVKAALKAAAGKTYWRTEAPSLRINYPLIKAVAWQESGWQSNIHNCDGGAGVMQVMPDTVSMINNRFGLSYDASVFNQNVLVGGNYLAWLTKWVGDRYFGGSYNLSAAKCKSASSWCPLNVVISGYNAGAGGIEQAAADKTLPNPEYVASVRALMKRCQCDQY
ncbi:lytic transglycosylase domain-containing protein [Paractinoplanes atraurantiacus]|uniref:Soluble lytic murein transglycosylase n=1 Tax=Paractinoplanes atraurantiacus TaxID=1036182 RepID=A0A285IV18_9ACTN|nr:lytic transglycosylase domain-containing protein [Actinoplanes atraurantiacus]SNY50771.1 Soluble lytic murein transglycosylase [Actinoplanes atraurantiacus]